MIQTAPTITYHTVTLGALTREGDTLAQVAIPDSESGEQQQQMVRVPAGLPGELVTIAVEEPPTPPTKKRRRRHWKQRPPRTWITQIHEPSPLRVTAPCPVFGTCGGCQLQHMRYEAQLTWKYAVVHQLLQEVGHFSAPPMLPTVPCDLPWNYRNHMRFSVNREGQPGLTERGTRRVLPLTECPIAHPHINQALSLLNQYQHPRPQLLLRCSAHSNQLLAQPLQSPEAVEELERVGLQVQTETMDETLNSISYRIRPSSFFQTNTTQAEKMVQLVLSGLIAKHQPATIIDAYCGVGTFAAQLAGYAKRVIAIEESPSAVKDARWNLREMPNVEILQGKVEALLPTLSEQVTGLVIDPPRAGCQPEVLTALATNPVSTIVYVSCDPTTLARDLDILCHQHAVYRLRSVQPLDMFPQTAHIETVCVLDRI